MERDFNAFSESSFSDEVEPKRTDKIRESLSRCIELVNRLSEEPSLKTEPKSSLLKELSESIKSLSWQVESLSNQNSQILDTIAEFIDVLKLFHKGDFSKRASTESQVEALRVLGELINQLRERLLDFLNKLEEQHKDLIELYLEQHSILSSIGVAVLIVDSEDKIEFVNREFEELTGFSKREVEGNLKWTEVFTEDASEYMMEYLKLKKISPELVPRQFESKIRGKAGKTKEVLVNIGVIPNSNRLIMSIADISERKRIAEQLIHSQKIEALGILSGRIAHEFNNILAGILGFAGILQMQLKDEKLKGYVQKIIHSGERAKELAKNLLTFSRKEIGNIQQLELKKFFTEFSEFIRQIIGKDIELTIELPEKEIVYEIDPSHLEIILMNFVTNARDAMPKGGKLTITLEERVVELEYHYTHPLIKPGRYIVLSISDTGIGMDEKTKERIFEPFFTTKPKGKGTGLGLSTVYGLVKNYDGQINVYSEVSKGTTFRIYLPYSKGKELTEEERVALRGSETILIVDDDSNVREFLRGILEEYGYRVFEASSYVEALGILNQSEQSIDLYLVDLIMPDTSGVELAREIKNRDQKAKILIMSGHRLDLKSFPTVEKTLTPEEILIKIRKSLNNGE